VFGENANDLKLCTDCPANPPTTFQRCSSLDPSLTRPFDHRSYPFSVQWLPLWSLDSLPRFGKKEGNNPTKRFVIRSSSLLQAHIPLSSSCILCIPTSSILLGYKIYLSNQVLELCKAWCWNYCHIRGCIWTLRILGTDTATAEPAVPLLTGTMSCILGTQYLGPLFLHRPHPNLR
jgi:hypothetical protein